MAFNLPVQNFFTRKVEPTDWVRPSDWPVITDAPNEVQFLMSDINDSSCTIRTQFTRTSGSQNIVIDWGDSTTSTVTTTAQTDTTKIYTPGTGTPCSRGYTTFRIRVYFTGTGVSVLNACRLFGILISGNTATPYYNVGLLEAYYGNGTQTLSIASYFESNSNSTSSLSTFNYLEYVKLPATVPWTSIGSAFSGCFSLAKVIMPTSASSLTSLVSLFFNCYLLREVTLPSNATGITALSNAFSNCFQLKLVTLPSSLNSCSQMSSAFSNCNSLKNITIPSINSCINLSSGFASCVALEWVKFISLPTFASSTVVDMSNAFVGCSNLQNAYFPATCSANANYTFSQTFQNCFNLKSIVFPSGFNPSTMLSAFASCSNLVRCIFQSAASNLTTLQITFQNCTNLTLVTLPSSVSSSGINLSTTFNGCISLKSLTIPSGYVITTMVNTFSGCFSFETLNWTPGSQNSLTSLQTTFSGCILLTSITLPTSMTSLTALIGTFNNCRSLISAVFPSSLNAVTNMNGCFTGCTLLTSVTLPTSMSSCINFGLLFQNCTSIRSITMPATVSSAVTTFGALISGCSSLTTIVFPSAAQLSSVTDIANMFFGCGNLTTITNFDKIGSLTATPLVTAGSNNNARLTSISFVMPLSVLSLPGFSNAATRTDVRSVRLLNTSAGQWTGPSPHINVSFTNMSTAQLVQLFNDMAAQGNVVSKTINITSAVGAAGLTAADRLIVTSKGWTITG